MKSKISLLLLFSLFVSFSSLPAQSDNYYFELKGELTDPDLPSVILLSYSGVNGEVADSVIIRNNGKFRFEGKISRPQSASLTMRPPDAGPPKTMEEFQNRDIQEFYIDGGEITVEGTGQIATAEIKGGPAQNDFSKLREKLNPLEELMKPYSEKMQKYMEEDDKEAQDELFPLLHAMALAKTKVTDYFIFENPDSWVSLDLVLRKSAMFENAGTVAPFFGSLSKELRETKAGKQIASRLSVAKKTGIGKDAPDFTLPDTKGNKVSLSDFQGQ